MAYAIKLPKDKTEYLCNWFDVGIYGLQLNTNVLKHTSWYLYIYNEF